MTNFNLHITFKNYTTIGDLYDLLNSSNSFYLCDAYSGCDWSSNYSNWENSFDHYVTDLYIEINLDNLEAINLLINQEQIAKLVIEKEEEILEFYNPVNEELEAVEFSNEIIEIDEDEPTPLNLIEEPTLFDFEDVLEKFNLWRFLNYETIQRKNERWRKQGIFLSKLNWRIKEPRAQT